MAFFYYISTFLLVILAAQQLSKQFANLAILFHCSRYLMKTTPICLSSQRILKSVSKLSKIILANDSPNWVDILETK